MESVIPNMEKAEENYKVPNLEKGSLYLVLVTSTRVGCFRISKSALDISQTTKPTYFTNTLVRLDYLIYNEATKQYKLSVNY